jgi:hypothetical protein
MFFPFADITTELVSLVIVGVGVVLLVIARVLSGGDRTITRRAYDKVYGGAPGAHSDRSGS